MRARADEIWSFVYVKVKNVPDKQRGHFEHGDVWTWTTNESMGIASLYPAGMSGCSEEPAAVFYARSGEQAGGSHQLTTDGLHVYAASLD
jgi:hypothetical protein